MLGGSGGRRLGPSLEYSHTHKYRPELLKGFLDKCQKDWADTQSLYRTVMCCCQAVKSQLYWISRWGGKNGRGGVSWKMQMYHRFRGMLLPNSRDTLARKSGNASGKRVEDCQNHQTPVSSWYTFWSQGYIYMYITQSPAHANRFPFPASSPVFSFSISSLTIAVNWFTLKDRSYLQLHGTSSCCWLEAVLPFCLSLTLSSK